MKPAEHQSCGCHSENGNGWFWTSLPDVCPTPNAQATGMCHLEMSKVPSNGVYVAELRDVSVSSAVSTHESTTHIAQPCLQPLQWLCIRVATVRHVYTARPTILAAR